MLAETLNIQVDGITLITGDVTPMIDEFEKNTACETIIYPEASRFTGKELTDYAKDLVERNKNENIKFLIITNNLFFIRGIECYSHILGTKEKINIYFLGEGISDIKKIDLNNRGIHKLYEKLIEPLDELDTLIQ